jgi:hypothetical protein
MSDNERSEYHSLQKEATEAWVRHTKTFGDTTPESEPLYQAYRSANLALRSFEKNFGIY